MTLLYKAFQSTMESKDGMKKWFPRLVKFGKRVTTREIADEIAEKSSLTRGDVYNVLDNLIGITGRNLMDGKSVVYEGLGTFTAVLRAGGQGVDTFEEVNDNQIVGICIRFTPAYTHNNVEGTTRALFKGISFQRIDGPNSSSGTNPGGDDDGYEQDPNA